MGGLASPAKKSVSRDALGRPSKHGAAFSVERTAFPEVLGGRGGLVVVADERRAAFGDAENVAGLGLVLQRIGGSLGAEGDRIGADGAEGESGGGRADEDEITHGNIPFLWGCSGGRRAQAPLPRNWISISGTNGLPRSAG